jgi:hypothetical protein
MMEAEIGPLSVRFDTRVGRYFRGNSLTPHETNCLREFFRHLQRDPVRQKGVLIAHNVWLFHICNHIVEMRLTGSGSGIVIGVYRDVSSSLPG